MSKMRQMIKIEHNAHLTHLTWELFTSSSAALTRVL